MENIISAARVRPVVIQSLFMKLDGAGPDDSELQAYVERLLDITRAGGKISHVQVYTVARPPGAAIRIRTDERRGRSRHSPRA